MNPNTEIIEFRRCIFLPTKLCRCPLAEENGETFSEISDTLVKLYGCGLKNEDLNAWEVLDPLERSRVDYILEMNLGSKSRHCTQRLTDR